VSVLARAQEWMAEVHPHARHLERTLDWLLALDPDASQAARIAAVTHDIERAYPEGDWDSARDWDSPEYNRWHQDRCARMVAAGLRERGADEELVRVTAGLVHVHEVGGWPEADLVQAADSLSFLETMVPLIVGWVESGRAPRERAAGKLEHSVERISADLPRAREIGAALLAPALSRVRAANAPDDVRGLLALVRTGRMHRLACDRFPRMPLWPGHPAFEVISYRTPQGIRAAGDQPWGPPNDACLGFMSELVMGTVHTGAHIDAHGHMTIEGRWHGGTAGADLGDFGPLRGDATEIPPLWRRGESYNSLRPAQRLFGFAAPDGPKPPMALSRSALRVRLAAARAAIPTTFSRRTEELSPSPLPTALTGRPAPLADAPDYAAVTDRS
jgi:hypothetical protein